MKNLLWFVLGVGVGFVGTSVYAQQKIEVLEKKLKRLEEEYDELYDEMMREYYEEPEKKLEDLEEKTENVEDDGLAISERISTEHRYINYGRPEEALEVEVGDIPTEDDINLVDDGVVYEIDLKEFLDDKSYNKITLMYDKESKYLWEDDLPIEIEETITQVFIDKLLEIENDDRLYIRNTFTGCDYELILPADYDALEDYIEGGIVPGRVENVPSDVRSDIDRIHRKA